MRPSSVRDVDEEDLPAPDAPKPGFSRAASLPRLALQSLGLLIVIPMLVIVYLFRESLAGKGPLLFLVLVLAGLGFYLLWSIIRAILALQDGLRGIVRGESRALAVQHRPSELREMSEIIDSLNKLTLDFRENAVQLERFIQQFSTLAELTEITARVPDINELLSLVLRKAMAATNARRGSSLLLREEGEFLDVISTEGWDEEASEPIRLRDSIVRTVIETGRPMLIDDIEKAGGIARPNDFGRYGSPSSLIMPLKTKAGTVGVVCLAEKASGDTFTQHDQQFLTVLLGQTGYAVENARLLKLARESAQNLKQTVQNQQMQIQDAQRQIVEAETLSALGQLAGGVAHDFNNIVQAIQGYAQLAQQGLPATDKRYQDMEQVCKAATRAAALTRELLAFGRRQVLQTVDLDLNDVIQDVVRMLRRLLGEHVELEIAKRADIGTVHADPRQLEQVLLNLCINARDAMPQGGKIRIETRQVRADEAFCSRHPLVQPGRYALMVVSDSGTGMDQSTLVQIFEPFFTTKGVGRGTGLGLATVYGIVKQHGGMIEVQSDIGQGTTFFIYLPVVDRPVAVLEERTEHPTAGGTETILLAEDEESVRTLTQRILEGAGYNVLTAADGEEAVRIFGENAEGIDLVLLDVVLPKMDGRSVCYHIRTLRPDVLFLFTSGYSSEAINTGFLQAENLDFIGKPVNCNDLLRKVRQILDTGAKRVGAGLAASGRTARS